MAAFLASLLRALLNVLQPLEAALESPEALSGLLEKYGWKADPESFSVEDVGPLASLNDDFVSLRSLVSRVADADDDTQATELALQGIELGKSLFAKVKNLSDVVASDLPSPFSESGFWSEFPVAVASDVVPQYLAAFKPPIYALLALLGIIEEAKQESGNDPVRITYAQRAIQWQRLGNLLNPRAALRDTYGWDADAFDANRLLSRLLLVASSMGIMGQLHLPKPELLDQFFDPQNPARATVRELHLLFAGGAAGATQGYYEVGLSILPIPIDGDRSGPVQGFAVQPAIAGTVPSQLHFGPIELQCDGGFETNGVLQFEVTPSGVTAQSSSASALDANLIAAYKADTPLVVFGAPGSHRLELDDVIFGCEGRGTASNADLRAVLGTATSRLILQTSEGDGFLKRIFGDAPQVITFGVRAEWSGKNGLHVSGSAELSITIPLHQVIGPLDLQTLTLLTSAKDDGLTIGAALDASAVLGPIRATVQGIGLGLDLTNSGESTSSVFGGLDVGLSFIPPTGAGLAINAGAITGGGFLSHDEESGRYAGVLDLNFTEIRVVAVALITTKLPSGQGFALMVNVGVTFNPALILSYGWTLKSVGGLLTLNRTTDVDALRSGLRNKTLDSILFPADPIANATRIISDSERVFPVEEGRFVIAPMLELGWGPDDILVANLAVVIELPSPPLVAILGQIKARFPKAGTEAIVVINLDVLGTWEPAKQKVSADATLWDSALGSYDLSGDSALRLDYGSHPTFAFSIGGFAPKYDPPTNFPALRRLTISLRHGNPSLSAKVYAAVTANCFMAGAKLELKASAASVDLDGQLSADFLIEWNPSFGFEADVSASISCKFHGHHIANVHLSGSIAGLTPMHFDGKVSVSICIWDATAHVSKTWGSHNATGSGTADPLPAFLAALQLPANWGSGRLPSRSVLESFKSVESLTSDESEILVHPGSALEIRQRIVPLETTLEKYGNSDVTGHYEFKLTLELGPEGTAIATDSSDVEEQFARGQYKDLSKSERLSKPSYEPFKAGIRVGPAVPVVEGDIQSCVVFYETGVIRADGSSGASKAVGPVRWSNAQRSLAALRAMVPRAGLSKFSTDLAPSVTVKSQGYSVVNTDTLVRNTLVDSSTTKRPNQTHAEELIGAAVNRGQVTRAAVQVVPEFEESAP